MFVATIIISDFNCKSILLTLPPYFSFACPKEGKAHALSQPCVPVTKEKDSTNKAYFTPA
jgi:hypothetical protein